MAFNFFRGCVHASFGLFNGVPCTLGVHDSAEAMLRLQHAPFTQRLAVHILQAPALRASEISRRVRHMALRAGASTRGPLPVRVSQGNMASRKAFALPNAERHHVFNG